MYKVALEAVVGTTNVQVNQLQFDSRKISLNDCFIAIKGTLSNGHDYIETAIEKGALVIVCEDLPSKIINGISYVQVKNSQKALAIMASNFTEILRKT